MNIINLFRSDEAMIPDSNDKDYVFSLDIGTRSVIGIVGRYEDDKFKIVASKMMEHEKRNMYDGQIHDINGVAKVVSSVKEYLEEEIGSKLKTVSIAAAGRALKTYRTRFENETDPNIEIRKDDINSLEIDAIQQAQQKLDSENEDSQTGYYCVGYSVVSYYLDDNFIENPEGHRGKKLSVELIATFLPHIVVDSLYTVMKRVGLEVSNMTLEPIAAINVAIKKNMRLLNLVLVDIGAGTSDIAITKEGSITAYGMVPVAGDEITEMIATQFLMDYDSAEALKLKLKDHEDQVFYDIVGIEHKMKTSEILERIMPSIENLANEIGTKIVEYNKKSPSAVFLIGGGSQIPLLDKLLAEKLEMQNERVVIRGGEFIENIENLPEFLKGPNAITPLGIGFSAVENMNADQFHVFVNDERIKMFNSKQIKISDALILHGYNPRNLIPKRGDDFLYYMNGLEKRIRGELGDPAKILLNGHESNLFQILKHGDKVQIDEASKGAAPAPKLFDIVSLDESVNLNNDCINLIKSIRVNDDLVMENIELKQSDRLEVKRINTVEDLLEYTDQSFSFKSLHLNDSFADIDSELQNGDIISVEYGDVSEEDESHKSPEIEPESTKASEPSSPDIQSDGKKLKLKVNGKDMDIFHSKDRFVFVDIFEYIDFDLKNPKGMISLSLNGKRAQYIEELRSGDVLSIDWK